MRGEEFSVPRSLFSAGCWSEIAHGRGQRHGASTDLQERVTRQKRPESDVFHRIPHPREDVTCSFCKLGEQKGPMSLENSWDREEGQKVATIGGIF